MATTLQGQPGGYLEELAAVVRNDAYRDLWASPAEHELVLMSPRRLARYLATKLSADRTKDVMAGLCSHHGYWLMPDRLNETLPYRLRGPRSDVVPFVQANLIDSALVSRVESHDAFDRLDEPENPCFSFHEIEVVPHMTANIPHALALVTYSSRRGAVSRPIGSADAIAGVLDAARVRPYHRGVLSALIWARTKPILALQQPVGTLEPYRD